MKTPREYQQIIEEFVALHSRASEELEQILESKPSQWMTLRDQVKSDKAADRLWEGTDEGIKEMRLRLQLKRLEKEISSAKSGLRILEGEARNIF